MVAENSRLCKFVSYLGFSWLVNVQEVLQGSLPKKLFNLKAKDLYTKWLVQNPTEPEKQLKFGDQWIVEWENKYGASLRKPNKRFSIKKEDLVTRFEDYLQNIWLVRNFFLKKYGIDPPVINGDEISLHWNENASKKTLALKALDMYVKENYMLLR